MYFKYVLNNRCVQHQDSTDKILLTTFPHGCCPFKLCGSQGILVTMPCLAEWSHNEKHFTLMQDLVTYISTVSF